MTLHRYRAIDSDGRRVRGEMDATDVGELEQRLRERKLVLIHGEARAARGHRGRRLPRRELIHFSFQLQQLLEAGVAPFESLGALHEACSHPRMRACIAAMLTDIERGQALSAAAARQPGAFAPELIALLRAGEEAGRLPEALGDIGEALRRDDELASHARRAAIYPAIVASLLLAVVVVALSYVVPELEKLFRSSGQTLPLPTRTLIALSHAFIRQIEEGRMISAAFEAERLFPPLLARMLKIGEHTGGLDRALHNIASLYRRDATESIARLQAGIEPALTVLMGMLLLWIATAVLGPIYGIVTQLPS